MGNESDHWEYIDEYENNSSRQFFDNTWNLEAMVENMKEKKATLQRELSNRLRGLQKLKKKLGLPIGSGGNHQADSGTAESVSMQIEDPACSSNLVTNPANQFREGITFTDGENNQVWIRTYNSHPIALKKARGRRRRQSKKTNGHNKDKHGPAAALNTTSNQEGVDISNESETA